MSRGPRSQTRKALVEWLEDAEIDGLDKVWSTFPRAQNVDFNRYGSGPHRCHAAIFFEEEGELRFAIGGPHSGKKRIDYLVAIHLLHRSVCPDESEVIDDFDRIVDEIKARLRADRRLSKDDSIVWQAGEGGYGIQCDFEPADQQGGGEPIENRGRIRFEITQWITA